MAKQINIFHCAECPEGYCIDEFTLYGCSLKAGETNPNGASIIPNYCPLSDPLSQRKKDFEAGWKACWAVCDPMIEMLGAEEQIKADFEQYINK